MFCHFFRVRPYCLFISLWVIIWYIILKNIHLGLISLCGRTMFIIAPICFTKLLFVKQNLEYIYTVIWLYPKCIFSSYNVQIVVYSFLHYNVKHVVKDWLYSITKHKPAQFYLRDVHMRIAVLCTNILVIYLYIYQSCAHKCCVLMPL